MWQDRVRGRGQGGAGPEGGRSCDPASPFLSDLERVTASELGVESEPSRHRTCGVQTWGRQTPSHCQVRGAGGRAGSMRAGTQRCSGPACFLPLTSDMKARHSQW